RGPRFTALRGEPVLQGEDARRGPRCNAQLVIDVLEVVLDGLPAEDELPGDLAVGQARAGQAQDLELTLGQVARVLWPSQLRLRPLPLAGEQAFVASSVELRAHERSHRLQR